MATWTYSRYRDGHQRPAKIPFPRSWDEEDESDLEQIAEECAKDDHYNYDGWEGDHSEREIFLFRDCKLHRAYTVTVEYEPTFSAQRAAAQEGE
jgi:hypothetical protein